MAALAAEDQRLADRHGGVSPFPLSLREPGFGTLLHIILEQQMSIQAARAMHRRLEAMIGPPKPTAFLALSDADLRRCGFSRQKKACARGVATAIADGSLDLEGLDRLKDQDVLDRLTAFKGIGRWTAECYLLWALGRRDVLPAGDMALQVGWQWLAGSDARPSADTLRQEGEAWRPRRTAASLLIWKHYLRVIAERRSAARPAAAAIASGG